jgi:DNA-binding response OmpR family regulator
MKKPNALIFGDYRENVDILAHALSQAGIKAVAVDLDDLTSKHIRDQWVDIVIVDIYDAATYLIPLCTELTTLFSGPVLVMGYENDERLLLRLYREGIAEYIAKPISMPLFVAKVSAWLRRIGAGKAAYQSGCDSFRVNAVRRFVTTPEGQRVRLSKLEYRLFEILHTNKGRVLPTDLLVDRIWGEFEDDDSRLKHLILRLRRKIEPNPSAPTYIETVGHEGYSFRAVDRSMSQM